MDRRVIPLLTAIAVLAALAIIWWRAVGPSLTPPPVRPALRTESMRLMEQWRLYSTQQAVWSTGYPTTGEAVALMNEHSKAAFPGETITFVLWTQGMPAPRGFAPNSPSPARPWMRDRWPVAPKGERRVEIVLAQLTDALFERCGFHIRVVDGQGYVFLEDDLIPPLITHRVSIPADVARNLVAGGGSAALPFSWATLPPGGSATASPDGREVTLRVEVESLARACAELDEMIATGSEWREMKTKLRQRREEAVRFFDGMLYTVP